MNSQLYCKPHYLSLFAESGGRYDKAFGAYGSDGKSDRSLNTSAASEPIAASNEPVDQVPPLSKSLVEESSSPSPVKNIASMFEKKKEGEASAPAPLARKQSGESVRNMMKVFEERGASNSSTSTTQKAAPVPRLSSQGKIKSMRGMFEGIPMRVPGGEALPPLVKKASASEKDGGDSMISSLVSEPSLLELPTQVQREYSEGELSHVSFDRPLIPRSRRKPTVESVGKSIGDVQGSFLEQSRIETVLGEEPHDEVVDENEDFSAVFFPSSDVQLLKQQLQFASSMFEKLEQKRRALRKLVAHKDAIIEKLTLGQPVPFRPPGVNPNPNPNEPEELIAVDDEDAFEAARCEERGELDKARSRYLAAYDKAIDKPSEDAQARTLASFASFLVRRFLGQLQQDDQLAQKVSDAFDALVANNQAIADTVSAEHAAFLSDVLNENDEALEAYRKAVSIFPENAELLCNYAKFVDTTLVSETEGDAREDFRSLAAGLYRDALKLSPQALPALINLPAILVEQSRSISDQSERNQCFEEARELLQKALIEVPSDAAAVYNLACIEAMTGNNNECMSLLERCIALDPSLRENLADDEDLENVKNESWFGRL